MAWNPIGTKRGASSPLLPRPPLSHLQRAQTPGLAHFAATFRGDALDAEAWLDVGDTNRLARGLIDRILRGYPIEVSTGLYLDRRRGTGEFNGKPYTALPSTTDPTTWQFFCRDPARVPWSMAAGSGWRTA